MENENQIKSIPVKPKKEVETFAMDIMKVAESNEPGIIKKIIEREEEKEMVQKNFSPASSKNKALIALSILFILLAVGALYAFMYFNKNNTGVTILPRSKPLIFIDQSQALDIKDLDKEEISQAVANQVNFSKVRLGGIEGVYLTENKKIIPLSRFLTLIGGNLNTETIQAMSPSFLIGIANQDSKNLFILLKPVAFTSVFDGMRSWENKMFYDLHDFFGIPISSATNEFLTKNFEDGFIQNKNARILYSSDKRIVLMYVYLDNNSVIIATDEKTVREVLTRLNSSKVKK